MRSSRMTAGVVALMAAAAWAAPALAHAHLEVATPADHAVVAVAPSAISLTFNEPVAMAGVSLLTASGEEAPVAFTPTHEASATYTLPLPALTPGDYEFTCRALGDDGHVMTETIHFSVSDGAEDGAHHSDGDD